MVNRIDKDQMKIVLSNIHKFVFLKQKMINFYQFHIFLILKIFNLN